MTRRLAPVLASAGLLLAARLAVAAPGSIGETEKQPLNVSAIAMFLFLTLRVVESHRWR